MDADDSMYFEYLESRRGIDLSTPSQNFDFLTFNSSIPQSFEG